MTEKEMQQWIQRLESSVAKTMKRRADRRQVRAQQAAARTAGLVERHRARLNRTTPAPDGPEAA
ncbi:hypothetical protein ACIA47_23570 [Micromonospora sp. NPDC051227]|uniref:hypothetical protein n=1 Tax=Micromonospora sp. NPDC051227 TaxID=3364285 RepID=UPI0037A833DF